MLPHSSPATNAVANNYFLEGTNSGGGAASSGGTAEPNSLERLEKFAQASPLDEQRVAHPPLPHYYPGYAALSWYTAHLGAVGSGMNVDSSHGQNKKAGGRQTYNADQKRILEDEFHRTKYVSKAQRLELKEKTGLSDKQIKIWFQNRRMKKKKQDHHQQGQTGFMGGAAEMMTQESSPSYTPGGSCTEKLDGGYRHDDDFQNGLAAVKSEPENGCKMVEQQELKSESMPKGETQSSYQQQPNGLLLHQQQHSPTTSPSTAIPSFQQQHPPSSFSSYYPSYQLPQLYQQYMGGTTMPQYQWMPNWNYNMNNYNGGADLAKMQSRHGN